MKKANRAVLISIRPYDAVMYFTTNRKAFERIRSKYKKQKFDSKKCSGACAADDGDNVIIVGVFDGSYATLAHELAHCVFKVLESRGVPTDENSSEAFCHSLSDLMEACLPLMGSPR